MRPVGVGLVPYVLQSVDPDVLALAIAPVSRSGTGESACHSRGRHQELRTLVLLEAVPGQGETAMA